MNPVLLGLLGFIIFVTHGLEAITGFGCTVLALPFVVALVGVQKGVILLSVVAWLLALYITVKYRRSIRFGEFGVILACTAIGMPIGIYAFSELPAPVLKMALGAFIVIAALTGLLRGPVPVGGAVSPVYHLLLVAGGAVHGAFASGGPFVVLYATRRLPDKGQFRATLCLLWATLNTALMVSYATRGLLGGEMMGLVAGMLPFLAGGVIVGERVHGHVNEALFRKVVFSVLLCVGVVMVLMH